MRVDLHIHTTASDGVCPPEEVVRRAVAGRLDVIAITDHDTVGGVAPARAAADGAPIQIVSGIEVSATHEGQDVHILGYFVDTGSEALIAHGRRAAERRFERMREMVDRLSDDGYDVSLDEVVGVAGEDHTAIGRPHLAAALVSLGHASSVSDAFNSLIGDDSPAFVPAGLTTPEEAIAVVKAAGGVPVWAHPPGNLIDELLGTLVRNGLRGIEVYRPSHRRHDVLRLEQLCRTGGLLPTGGSDWHSAERGSQLGDFFVDAREIEGILSEGGI